MNIFKRIISILLIALMIVPLISSVSFATPQSDLDAGYVQMTANGNITLRKGEVYYVAVRGGTGGRGGSAKREPRNEPVESSSG